MATTVENIELYEEQAKRGVNVPLPYDRLMIYYRKQKAYKKELRLVNRAIKVFSDRLKRLEKQVIAMARSKAALKRLSVKIGQSSGLIDKKGNARFAPEPIARWTKRKQIIEAKIKKEHA